jgi:hypothetical protein
MSNAFKLLPKKLTDASSTATVNPDTPNVLQAMMKLEQVKVRAKTSNKVALESEKEKDAAETDVHEMITEVDDWDLRDHIALVCVMPTRETQGTNSVSRCGQVLCQKAI